MLKLCVFPSDPIQAYIEKGEIKPRYFNPSDLFDEIHVMNLSNEEINLEEIKISAGRANLFIHSVDKINLMNLHSKKNNVLNIVRKISPNVIRSYNPLIQGWLAAYCKKKLKIPYVLSIHGNYQKDIMKEYWENHQFSKYFKLLITRHFTEKISISSADWVICVHNHLVPYVKNHSAKNEEVIFNKVDLKQFQKSEPVLKKNKPIILNVANFRKIKNQQCLLHAVKDLDVFLVLIGKGEMLSEIKDLAKKLEIENKVIFIESVPHSKIQNYYASARIFAVPSTGTGFPITVLEALASQCIVVMAERNTDINEPIDSVVNHVKNNPASFKSAFQNVLENPLLYEKKSLESIEIMKSIDEKVMERLEASIYKKISNK